MTYGNGEEVVKKIKPTEDGVFDLTELKQNVNVDYGKIKGLLEQGKTPTLRVEFEGVVLDLKVLTTGEICIEPDTINRINWSLTEDRVNALQSFQKALAIGQSILPLRGMYHITSYISSETNPGEDPRLKLIFKVGDDDNPQGSLTTALFVLNNQMPAGGNTRSRGGYLANAVRSSTEQVPQINLISGPEDSEITKDL